MSDPESNTESEKRPEPRSPREFASTRWSVVVAAAQPSSTDANEALASLCQDYWYPLYAYACRRIADQHEAQDLIQEFFTRLLEKDLLATAERKRGRFRTFLLTALSNFLNDQWHKSRTQKRGGGRQVVSLDFGAVSAKNNVQATCNDTPERVFDRQWATTLLDHVMAKLRNEFVVAGKEPQFEQLKPFLAGRQQETSYATAARRLGITEGAALVAAHRLRSRYRQLLRSEIMQTVASEEEVDDEIRSLFASLGR